MPIGILFLDDEQNVLNALRRVFRDVEDVEFLFTTSPDEALTFAVRPDTAVVFSDQRMPSMDGVAFLERVKEVAPEAIRILLTGHGDMKMAQEAINRGAVYRFLSKPWDDEELRHILGQARERYELAAENRRLQEVTRTQNQELKKLNEGLEQRVRQRTREIQQLNGELEKSLLGAVRVAASLIEVHNQVIGSHSRRVAALAKGMARKLRLAEGEILQVEVAGLLHDIGETVLPAEILNKEEHALTADERERLRRHPLLGATIVHMVPNMERAARMVRHHHERFYGGGFPDRLKGDDIPLGARILAVADAYDECLNTRAAFRQASPAKVLEQLRKRCPTEFDPEVVEALEQSVRDGDRFREDTEEVEVRVQDLRAGMRVSRDIRDLRGNLLVSACSTLTEELLKTLQDYPETSRCFEGIFIYRKDPFAQPLAVP